MRSALYRKAFTLIELLIVIVILGIIAAIVIPQFGKADDDAKVAALKTNLATIRSQLEFYKVQHNSAYPDDKDSITAQLTTATNIDGGFTTPTFGPYIRAPFPDNPFTLTSTIDSTGAYESAWRYELGAVAGAFNADDNTLHAGY